MILTPILLLNMLIASMGNTYQRVISISEKERNRQVSEDKSEVLCSASECCFLFY